MFRIQVGVRWGGSPSPFSPLLPQVIYMTSPFEILLLRSGITELPVLSLPWDTRRCHWSWLLSERTISK